MLSKTMVIVPIVLIMWSGCQSTSPPTLLSAPTSVSATAARHHEEGILAYKRNQWAQAKQHFEAAITATPSLAEAHYNLGMVLYRLGAVREGDAHFMKAADLAPGNTVIWDSPPLRNVTVPDKASTVPGLSDGHGH